MHCRKCGQLLSDESTFCNKCGSKIEKVSDNEYDSENCSQDNNTNIEAVINEVSNVKKYKVKDNKPLVISTVITIIIFSIIGYNAYFNSQFNQAKALYSEGKYYDAEKKLNGLINFSGDKQFNEIKYAGQLGAYYQFYKSQVNPQYDFATIDYVMAIEYLFDGTSCCLTFEKTAKTDMEKDSIINFKEKYYNELNNFNISKGDIDNILKLDYDSRKSKISEIANSVKTQKNEVESNRNKPIEFKNLSWDSNSSYTIATGQVYNKSDRTVKFVTIKISFKDKSGNVIDTDSTYAVGSEGLEPGESTKWRASVNKDSNIDSYSVSLIDFQN